MVFNAYLFSRSIESVPEVFEKLQHAGQEVQEVMTRLTTEGASSTGSICDMQSISSYLKVSGLFIVPPHLFLPVVSFNFWKSEIFGIFQT